MHTFVKAFTESFDFSGVEKRDGKYYLVDASLRRAATGKPVSIGIFLGEEKMGFRPSPALIDMIARASQRKAFITDDAAWLFLCGRDVFQKSVVRMDAKEGLILVQNQNDENLGYGKIVKSKECFMIKNLLDKGAYLRMERGSRQ